MSFLLIFQLLPLKINATRVLSVSDEALHYFIVKSKLRVILLDGLSASTIEGLKKLRPTPDAYSIIADTVNMEKLFKKVTFEEILYEREWAFQGLNFLIRSSSMQD